MVYRPLLTLVLVSMTAGTVACDGCASDSGKVPAQAERLTVDPSAVLAPELSNPLAGHHVKSENLGPVDGRLLQYAGELDFKNHYSSTVMVTTGDPTEGAQCSGVLIGPRLVLTAGSCVCQPSPTAFASEGGRMMDGSACVERVHVVTVVYGKVHDRHTADMEVQAYAGVVRPHPELKVLLDERSSMVTSHADLAVILLEAPVESGVAYASVADSEVVADEPLVTAGYGHAEGVEQAFGERYVRRNKVASALSSDSEEFAYVPLSLDIHGNHGGWPCFRENGSGRWLVGIVSKASGEKLACVSTHTYRKWLRAEGERAARQGDRPK